MIGIDMTAYGNHRPLAACARAPNLKCQGGTANVTGAGELEVCCLDTLLLFCSSET